MGRPIRILVLGCLAGWLFGAHGGVLLAQSPAPAPAAAEGEKTPAEPQEPGAYPLIEIVRGTEETTVALRGIKRSLESSAVETQAESALSETAQTLEKLASTAAATDLPGQSIRSLTEIRQSWLRLQSRIKSIVKTLEGRASGLDADLARLKELETRWSATRDLLSGQPAESFLSERVETILARLAELEGPATEAFYKILRIEDSAASQSIRVAEVLESLDRAIGTSQEREFAQRGWPLWRILGSRDEAGPIGEAVLTIGEKFRETREYFSEERWGLFSLIIVLLALVVLSLLLRARSGLLDEGSIPRRLLETRALSSGVLVGLVAWIYSHLGVPRPVIEMAVVALIVPMFRVLTLWLPQALHRSLLWLAALGLFNTIRGLVSEDSWAGRLGVLALAIGGAALILWTLRGRGPWSEMREESRWIRSLVLVSRVVAGGLVLSAAANVIGQVGIARALARGAIVCLFLGAVLAAGVLVVETWLGLLTAGRERLTGHPVAVEAQRLRRHLSILTRVAAIVAWIFSILTVFGIGTTVVGALSQVLVRQWAIGSVSISLANLLGFAAALLVGLTTARLLRLLLDHAVLPRLDLPRGVPAAVSTTVQYVIATLGILTAIFALGIEASRFTILAGAVGVGVGFGLQNVVNNFVSGLILLYERPIQTGDTIELGTLTGHVERIGVRSSTVRTFEGAEVIVPNATLISNEVTNWTLSDRLRRVDVPVGVAYGTDPRRVIALLEEVAGKQKGVLAYPAPLVLFQGFGDSSLNFSVRVWTPNFDEWLRLRSELHVAILEALAGAGIEIPFPQRVVHMQGGSGEPEG